MFLPYSREKRTFLWPVCKNALPPKVGFIIGFLPFAPIPSTIFNYLQVKTIFFQSKPPQTMSLFFQKSNSIVYPCFYQKSSKVSIWFATQTLPFWHFFLIFLAQFCKLKITFYVHFLKWNLQFWHLSVFWSHSPSKIRGYSLFAGLD